jgi:nucleoside-diphosphate-sugar epimerase
MLKDKTILVTGATGFVGSNLTRHLVQTGCDLHIITRDESKKWRIRDILNLLEEHKCDLRDINQVKRLIAAINPDIVYHLAAYGIDPSSRQNLDRMIETNITGTMNLMTALATTEYDVFVNSGSFFEYGLKTEPAVETAPLEPTDYYSVSKVSASLFGQVFARSSGEPVVTLRLFSPFGYYEGLTRLIPTVITSCLRGRALNLTKGEQARDFVFIEDIVDAYLKASTAPKVSGEIINIGTGIPHTVREVVSQILEVFGNPIDVIWGALPYRSGETRICIADNSKAKRLLDWEPRTDLNQGLLRTIDWFRENLHLYAP